MLLPGRDGGRRKAGWLRSAPAWCCTCARCVSRGLYRVVMPLEILPSPKVAMSYAVLIPASGMMLCGHTKCSGPAILHPPQFEPSISESEQGLWSELCLQSKV